MSGDEFSAIHARALADAAIQTRTFESIRAFASRGDTEIALVIDEKQAKNLLRLGFTVEKPTEPGDRRYTISW